MTETVRSFVAVPLPEDVQRRIAAAAAELARELPQSGIKWSRKVENLHITVKFLGQVDGDKLAALSAELATALAPLPRFRLEVRGMGAFSSPRRAHVIWAGADDIEGGLAAVAAVVEDVCERLGFERERRTFTGHVTVGRAKERGGVDVRAALDAFAGRNDQSFGGTTVGEVHVYESRLGGEGSTYVLRSRAALGSN
jgi:RNA 2',3'-cyclic 3'-phosphodiesterase